MKVRQGMVSISWLMVVVMLLGAFVPAQAIVGQFLQSFREFPPSQKAGSFGIGQALEALQDGPQGPGK